MNSLRAQIYVSGPLTNGDNIDALKAFYERIGELCRQKGMGTYIPHNHTDPFLNPGTTPNEVYLWDMRQVAKADLVIAYVGLPSHGVGAEIERAYHVNVDVILLYEHNTKVSRLIRGCPAVVKQVVFSDFSEALEKLDMALDQWLAWKSSQSLKAKGGISING